MTAECECATCHDLRALGEVADILAAAKTATHSVQDVEIADQVRKDIEAIRVKLTTTARLAC